MDYESNQEHRRNCDSNSVGRPVGAGSEDTAAEGDIERFVKEFETATDRLKDHFGRKQAASGDAEEVLRRGAAIDGFMRRFSLSSRAQSDWAALRGNLDELASAYGVTWNW